MYKLKKKDKTKFMKLVLSFFILLNLILGFVFFKIKVMANNLDLELIKKNIRKAEYDVKICLYFWGFIKIGSIRLSNGFVKFLFIKKSINEIKNSDIYLKNIKPKINKISKRKMVEDFKKINFKLENLKLDLELGTDSVVVTSILIGILSAIISSSMQVYIEKFNKEKYKWKILPNFEEKIFINLNASLKLSYSPILSKIVKHV